MQTAADMAQQARQERDHGARHAGHLDEQAEKHEQRHRQQDEMAHAFIHAADQHHQRRMRRQSEIAEHRKAEGEGDRHAGEHRGRDNADKKDQKIEIAELAEQRRGQPEHGDKNGHRAQRQ